MDTLDVIGALFAALVPTSAVWLWILRLVITKELAKFRSDLIESLDKKFMPAVQIKEKFTAVSEKFESDRHRLLALEKKHN